MLCAVAGNFGTCTVFYESLHEPYILTTILLIALREYPKISSIEFHGIVRRLNLLWINQSPLPPNLIHNFHNHNTLLPSLKLAFLSPFHQRRRRLIRFPKHPMPLPFRIIFPPKTIDPPAPLPRSRMPPLLLLNRPISQHKFRLRRSVRRRENLDLALIALHPATRCCSRRIIASWRRRDTYGCCSHGVSVTTELCRTWECQDNGGHFVGLF